MRESQKEEESVGIWMLVLNSFRLIIIHVNIDLRYSSMTKQFYINLLTLNEPIIFAIISIQIFTYLILFW